MARQTSTVRYRKGQLSFVVDRHPGRPDIGSVLGKPLFGNRGKRFVSANASEDSMPCEYNFKPTNALPGSIEKILVLIKRVENHQPLHHPDDRVD